MIQFKKLQYFLQLFTFYMRIIYNETKYLKQSEIQGQD